MAVCGLLGIALLQAFLTAQSVSRFQALLFQGSVPFILFFPTLAVVTIPLVYCALRAADQRAAGATGAWLGLACAVLVVAMLASHMAIWFGQYRTCTALGPYLLDMAAAGCMRRYGGLDFLVYPALGFLAAAVFGNPGRVSPAERRGRLRGLTPATASATTAVVLAALLAAGHRADAQGVETKGKTAIRVGFRVDAEPFSFRSDLGPTLEDPHPRQYGGYIADLCYYIFDNSKYQITEVGVTAEDRFDLLKGDVVDKNGTKSRIDVLCDPATLRFSEPNRTSAGLFSPIVFASSVTYLENLGRGQRRTVFVAYVANTTADLVLKHACEIDLFGSIPYDERDHLPVMCRTAEAAKLIEKLRLKTAQREEATDDLNRTAMNKYRLDRYEVTTATEALAQATRAEELFAQDELRAASLDKAAEKEQLLAYWRDVAATAATLKTGCTPTACGDPEGALKGLLDIEAALGAPCSQAANPPLQPPAVPGTSDGEAAKKAAVLNKTTLYRYCPMESHKQAIEWLCGARYGDARGKSLIYLGDREIILGKLRTWRRHDRCSVASETGAEDLTYEPYALLVSKNAQDPLELLEHVQRRVYEFFSYKPRAQAAFDAAFPKDTSMSPLLAYLFLLNGVEEERNFTYPEDTPPPENAGLASLAEGAPQGALTGPRPRGGGVPAGRASRP